MKKRRKLVQSSPKTRKWLNIIRSDVKKKIPALKCREGQYWVSFKPDIRKVDDLNPTGNQIRLFTILPVSSDNGLEPTPSTENYAKWYPSIFMVKSEYDIEKATSLIIKSYCFELEQQLKRAGCSQKGQGQGTRARKRAHS